MGQWRELVEWDWVQAPGTNVLHAVGALRNSETVDEDWLGEGITACGEHGPLAIPGMFARMSAARCAACCALTAMPAGTGSPKNDDACRPLAAARAADT